MPRIVYHVLPETEPFSAVRGGAISRWVAAIGRDDPNTCVVTSAADTTWGWHNARLHLAPQLRTYAMLSASTRNHLPDACRKPILRTILGPVLGRLQPGDVLWIHNRPVFAAALAALAQQHRAHLVLHLHNSHLAWYRGRVHAGRLIFCSRYLEQESLRFRSSLPPSTVIPNGADDADPVPATAPASSLHTRVLFVGRLVPEKGAHIFLQAMRLLHHEGVPGRGRIIGSPAFGKHPPTPYERRIRHSAPPNVEFTGFLSGSELAAEYAQASIFCCPSIWQEPFGMVNVEAMSSGLAVVASAVGGIPEVFREGGALLVAPGNAAELAAAIRALINDPALRKRVASAGHTSFLRNYRWSVIQHQYRQLLESLPSEPLPK